MSLEVRGEATGLRWGCPAMSGARWKWVLSQVQLQVPAWSPRVGITKDMALVGRSSQGRRTAGREALRSQERAWGAVGGQGGQLLGHLQGEQVQGQEAPTQGRSLLKPWRGCISWWGHSRCDPE